MSLRSPYPSKNLEKSVLIHRLKISGLLSFGPKGIDLPLEPLNVLIGPNGSGKSNLLEALALLRAAPNRLPEPVKEMGGVENWLWQGHKSDRQAILDAIVDYPAGQQPIRHVLEITSHGDRFEVADERIENEAPYGQNEEPYFFYRYQRGNPILNNLSSQKRGLKRENVKPEESILSQVRDPESYPVLNWLQEQYKDIALYRNWSFGPMAPWRRGQSAHGRSDVLADGGENLALVLSQVRLRSRDLLLESLQVLFDGIKAIDTPVSGGNVILFLDEGDGRQIPATRLSDGTLRYIALLAILLNPTPPPLVAIEEPELGLHPDVIPHIAKLLVRASEHMQLVVTTHSRMLIDALGESPSSVVVCGKENGESTFERLDDEDLKDWLKNYNLGDLWSMGELGGNRW